MTENLPEIQKTQAVKFQSTFSIPVQKEGEDIWNWAKMLGTSPFYQKLGPGGVAAIILTAKELDFPPMACLNGLLHNIEGKITLSGVIINMMIHRAGHEARIVKHTNEICTIKFKRSYETEWQFYSFSIDDAKAADLLKKDNWRKYARAMLFNRCISAGAKIYMAEILGPYHTPEEIEKTSQYTPSKEEIEMVEVQGEHELDSSQQPDTIDNEQQEVLKNLFCMCNDENKHHTLNKMKSYGWTKFSQVSKEVFNYFQNGMEALLTKQELEASESVEAKETV